MADSAPLPPLTPAADGPTFALFDMDRTLLTVNSASLWLKFERQEGRLGRADLLRGLWWMGQYHLGVVDMRTVTARALALSTGERASEMTERCERWYREWVRPTVSTAARRRLEEHRAAGHAVGILTASTQFGAGPLARELEVPLVSTVLEVVDGSLTGRVVEPLCYGEGKRERAEHWLAERGGSLERTWFYSDSFTDLPMLEAVGHPVAVNADPRLAREARRRGWPSVRFD